MDYKIAVIGAGKIAHSLVPALIKSGYKVEIIISRNIESAKEVAIQNKIKNYSDDLSDLNNEINLFILSVPDNQIKKTAEELTKQNLNFKNSTFIHLSGAEDISVLESLKKKKAFTASIHIMQTFPSKKPVTIKNCSAAIETDDDDTAKLLFKLSKELKLKPFRIESQQKVFYHLTGVFASNFLNANIFNSNKIFKKFESGETEFFPLIQNTLKSTINNIEKEGAADALSGPVERGDVEIIEKHIFSLKKDFEKNKSEGFNILLLNYLSLSLTLIEVAEKKRGKLNEDHKKIKKLLMDELEEIV